MKLHLFLFCICMAVGLFTSSLFAMGYDLYLAVAVNDITEVRKLDPDGVNKPLGQGGLYYWTPLFLAANHGQDQIVQYYVEKLESRKEDINPAIICSAEDALRVGVTPLCQAASNGHLIIVQYYVEKLKKKGMDFNPALTKGRLKGFTPLALTILSFCAIDYRCINVIHYYLDELVKAKKNINPVINDGSHLGWSLLRLAVHRGGLDVVKLLLERGVQLDNGVQEEVKMVPCGKKKESSHRLFKK